jgi:hypothetical protein
MVRTVKAIVRLILNGTRKRRIEPAEAAGKPTRNPKFSPTLAEPEQKTENPKS